MENDKVFKINELVTNDNNLDLKDNVDRCYIDTKGILGFDVYVAGGDLYGEGVEKYKTPHFHVIYRLGDDVFKYMIEIPNKDNMVIKFIDYGLNGLLYIDMIKNKLIKWLNDKSDYSDVNTNLNEIQIFWNHLNNENETLKQLIIF